MNNKINLSKHYQRKTDREHVLDNPDTYIGSIEKVDSIQNIMTDENNIEEKEILYIPGLYKLFDEGIVNCRDHYVRMKKNKENQQVTYINVEIKEDYISLTNDGEGIDIVKLEEYDDIYAPSLIFGKLLTGSNYDQNKEFA